jgi:hypothetical protein
MRCWKRAEEIAWTDRVRNGTLGGVKEERNIVHTLKRREANWIGHILLGICLLHVVEGKVEGKIEVSGSRGRGSKQLLGDEKVMETERGSTRSPFMENWLWKRLWTCRKAVDLS